MSFLQNKKRIQAFCSFYAPYKWLFAADVLCSLLAAMLALGLPLLVRRLIETISDTTNTQGLMPQIWPIAGTMVVMILLQTAFTLFYDHKGHILGARMERDMRDSLFMHLQKLPVSFFDQNKTGDLMSRVTNDLQNLSELCHHGPEDILIYAFSFVGALIIMAKLNAGLTLVVCAFLPFMVVYALIFNKKLSRAYKRSFEKIAQVNVQLEDSLAGIRTVKSFAAEGFEGEKFGQTNQIFYQSRSDIYKYEAYYYTILSTLCVQLITVVVIVFGAVWITGAKLAVADLLVFLLYVGYLTAPLPQIARIIQQYQQGFAGFGRFMDIMELPTEDTVATAAVAPFPVQGRVQLRDVTFRYAENGDNIFENLQLSIAAGEYIALVGPSGIGKTTLCNLIPRFYPLLGGQILLDDVDTAAMSLPFLRGAVGMVQQEVYLFHGTILDNIRYSLPHATEEEVIAAAQKANAHDFISALPQGYHTDIGPRGVRLSGGQRQRISIARVFLKNPPVLIFDEATSALDNESEQIIHEALGALAQNRTTIVIAHRLSTIRNAQRIVVLGASGIEEEGTHQELLQKGGTYARLYGLAT